MNSILPKRRISVILAARRKELHLTQKTISDYLGLKSPEHIGLIERGKRRIDLDRVPLLADIIEFDRSDLTKIWLAENASRCFDALFGQTPTADGPPPLIRAEVKDLLDLFDLCGEEQKAGILAELRSKSGGRAKSH